MNKVVFPGKSHDTDLFGGKPPGCYLANPNLLINGDFRPGRLINQRGKAEYECSRIAGYTVDEWGTLTTSVTVKNYGIHVSAGKINNYKRFTQMVELPLRTGDIYTITFLMRVNEVGGVAILRPVNPMLGSIAGEKAYLLSASADFETKSVTFQAEADYDYFGVQIMTVTGEEQNYFDVDIQCAKLEQGPFFTGWSTISPALELIKCQRYYQVHSRGDIPPNELNPLMRINPTVQQRQDGLWEYIAGIANI